VCDSKQHRPDISEKRRAMGGVVNYPDVKAPRRHLVDLRLPMEIRCFSLPDLNPFTVLKTCAAILHGLRVIGNR
jgi:hypothetical protein